MNARATKRMVRSMGPARPVRPARPAQRGATLIELMVAILIGMMMTVAIFSVLATSEGRKRTLTSLNDVQQSANVALYLLDKAVRSAGTGYAQTGKFAYGCRLLAQKDNTQALPLAAAMPAPFAALSGGTEDNFYLAPLMILPDATTPGDAGVASDALAVMSASAGYGETPMQVTKENTTTALTLDNTVSYKGGDLVLVSDVQLSNAGLRRDCMVTQVATGFAGGQSKALTLGGSYKHDAIDGTAIDTSYTSSAYAANLGPAPQFQVLGVGDHSTLFSYDLLQLRSPALRAQAEGVYLMYALYGLDTDIATPGIDSWTRPTGDYAPDALADRSEGATERLGLIKAVRVALVMRTPLAERDDVTSDDLTLFADAGADNTVTVAITGDARRYRYRVVESVIPLRNNLLLTP